MIKADEAIFLFIAHPVFGRVFLWMNAPTKKKPLCKHNGFLCHNGFYVVPRRGLEPPRLAALVPETSASTNSATWADRFAFS